MNVVERVEDRAASSLAALGDLAALPASGPPPTNETTPKSRRPKLRPLLALVPYVTRYRGQALAALVALIVASAATLAVPVAVRRMIDMGFSPEGVALINSYFSVMIAVVAVLAGASAARYYLVITLGERIVADLRRDVFNHLTSLSPSFFDTAHSGELVSRLTADTRRSNLRSARRCPLRFGIWCCLSAHQQ